MAAERVVRPRRDPGTGSARELRDGRWQARRSVGPRGDATVFSAYGRTKEEALNGVRDKIAEHQRRVELGDAADWTVGDMLDWFTAEYLPARVSDGRLADTSAECYERVVRLHIRPALAGVPLEGEKRVRAAHVRRMMAGLAAAGLADGYRALAHRIASVAFNAAITDELYDRPNPVGKVDPPRVRPARRPGTPLETARALLAAVDPDEHRYAALWRLMLSAPMRPGEPSGALVGDFHLESSGEHPGCLAADPAMARQPHWCLRRNLVQARRALPDGRKVWVFAWHDTKGRRPRWLPLPPATVAALKAHRARVAAERLAAGPGWSGARIEDADGSPVDAELMFPRADGSPVRRGLDLADDLEAVCAAAGVPRMTPRDLRHAAVTLLRAEGTPLAVVQQLAGHRSEAVTDAYTGVLAAECRAAVDALAERLS